MYVYNWYREYAKCMSSERGARIEVARRYEKLIIIKIINYKNKPGTGDKLQMGFKSIMWPDLNLPNIRF